MTDAWALRALAVGAEDFAARCRATARHLRDASEPLADAVDDALEAIGPDTWDARAAEVRRQQLLDAGAQLALAVLRVWDRAAELDAHAAHLDGVAAARWQSYWVARQAELTDEGTT